MNPPNASAAREQATQRVRVSLRHPNTASARQLARRAGQLAERVWRRWQVGIHRWQGKHVRWLLEHELRHASPHTRYQYWLAARSLLRLVERSHLEAHLRGPWMRPTAIAGELKPSGRRARVRRNPRLDTRTCSAPAVADRLAAGTDAARGRREPGASRALETGGGPRVPFRTRSRSRAAP